MATGVLNQEFSDYFTVVDDFGNLITGLDSTSFIVYIYNPSETEVSSSLGYTIVELSNGNYKISFTPDVSGRWFIMVTNSTYFPYGKTDDVEIVSGDLTGIYDAVIRTLGLVHHNIYIDNPTYDDFGNLAQARLRIYDSAANVGTSTGVIETYAITSDGTESGKFSYWKQVKI